MRAARPQHPAASLSPPQRYWRKALSRVSPLACEISLVVALKFLLLWLLWLAFFSQPVARHMRLEPVQVERQLLHVPALEEAGHAQR
jgi:hypothetical protein